MTSKSQTYQAAVIGAGFAGLTTAIELARLDLHPIALIYDDTDINFASKAAQGVSAIKGILEADAELFALKLAGHRGFDSWLKGLELLLDRERPTDVWVSGVSENFRTKKSFNSEFGRIYRRDFIGAKNVTLSFEDDVEFVRAVYPGDFWVDINYLLGVLTDAALKLGVKMIRGSVVKVEAHPGSASLCLESGQVRARSTIIAAGPGSFPLIAELNTNELKDTKGVAGLSFSCHTQIPDRCEVKGTSSVVVRCGKAFWGSTTESAIAPMVGSDLRRADSKMEELTAKELASKVQLNPADLHRIKANWGIRIRAKDRAPVVKKIHEMSNIWINTAYYKSGVILAWMFAERLAPQVAHSLKSAEHPETSNH